MPKHRCIRCDYKKDKGFIYSRTCPKCGNKYGLHYINVKRNVALGRRLARQETTLVNESIELEEL